MIDETQGEPGACETTAHGEAVAATR
jgi:hypothetical protein